MIKVKFTFEQYLDQFRSVVEQLDLDQIERLRWEIDSRAEELEEGVPEPASRFEPDWEWWHCLAQIFQPVWDESQKLSGDDLDDLVLRSLENIRRQSSGDGESA